MKFPGASIRLTLVFTVIRIEVPSLEYCADVIETHLVVSYDGNVGGELTTFQFVGDIDG
jgi:hypothetical protein